jgi:hypothetical protein
MDNNYDDCWEQFLMHMEEYIEGKEDYENQSTKGEGDEHQSSNERNQTDSRQTMSGQTELPKV